MVGVVLAFFALHSWGFLSGDIHMHSEYSDLDLDMPLWLSVFL